ncbi:Hypothetical predicted protein [Octopus vulgaris]|uniref:Uncharacterized protein n=1 Tax=Octopus vulgaris TaxID=6645 RepID=A0AA36F7T2_OCTVU|nr:Hypothetical predicted protein [Octopus vulgaris]
MLDAFMLQDITSKIFLSGVGGTNRLILYVRSIWKFEVPGMNAVHLKKYNVQLSYPNCFKPTFCCNLTSSVTIEAVSKAKVANTGHLL